MNGFTRRRFLTATTAATAAGAVTQLLNPASTQAAPIKYEFKGTLKGNVVSGNFIPPLGGTGEYFTAKLTYAAATKSFSGKIGYVGKCQGTSTLKAKKA